ncbi:helix-turn-helix domain-containing protein [Bradyrhizobium cenepequi]
MAEAQQKKPEQKPFKERFPARKSAALRTLAANLRRLRKERGWSQDTLAAAAGIDQNAVSLIENRRSNPTVVAVEGLADAFKVPIAELLTPGTKTRSARGGA